MNAQQLKNAILQEAIEGRLVPQDPNDEPASALLARIRKEKEELVKAGKLKKKDLEVKPISEDEIPFEIPESWEWVRLITLSKYIHYGYTASAAPKGNSKLLRITDIQDDKVHWATVPFCTIKDNDLEKYQLHNRDILIARTGGTIGKTYIVRELNEVAVFASYLIRAIPLESVYEEYLKLFMSSPCYWTQLTDAASGTGQPNVNGQSLSNLIVPLPPLAEQKRIVAKIEELLPKVEKYGKAQDELNKLNEELPGRLKKSILQEAIEGRLVPQDPNDEPASVLLEKIREEKKQLVKAGKLKKKDLIETPISEDEIPFAIPDTWEWCRIKSIFSMQAGKNVTSADISNEKNGIFKYPCYGGNGLRGYVKSYNTEGIFPLVGRQGALCGNINLANGKFWATEHAVVTDGFGMTGYEWQYYFLIALNLNQYATATAQPGLAVSNIIEVLIPLPPLAEQKRIVAKIEQLLGEIDKLKK